MCLLPQRPRPPSGVRLLQHWLSDEDVDAVMAQYDTNKDGVIK